MRNTKATGASDSACSGNYIMVKHASKLLDLQDSQYPIKITLPGGSTLTSTQTGLLDIPQLPIEARIAHVFPGLTEMSLISTPQLCDAGLNVRYTADEVIVTDSKAKEVLRGKRDEETKMWMLPLTDKQETTQPTLQCANVIHHQNNAERVEFVSRMMGNPAYSTLLRAAQNPGQLPFPTTLLTAEMVRKNPPDARRAALGHLDLNRQNQRSTQRQEVQRITDAETDEDDVKSTDEPIKSTTDEKREFYTKIWTTPSFKASMDATGLAPTRWHTKGGPKYMLVLYNYDANYIMLLELANDTAPALRDAYKAAHDRLKTVGMAPKFIVMDNKLPELVKRSLVELKVSYQLVPPETHRTSAAERAIRTGKNHVVATIAGIDEKCPPSVVGRTDCEKDNSKRHSTYCDCRESARNSPHINNCTERTTSMQHQWHHWAPPS